MGNQTNDLEDTRQGNVEGNLLKVDRTIEDIRKMLLKYGVVENHDVQLEDYQQLSIDDSYYCANIFKLTIVCKNKRMPIIIKRFDGSEAWPSNNEMFRNEILMYENILPKFCPGNFIGEYYCGEANTGEGCFVILKDLKADGFCMSKENMLLPEDHIVMALKQLGVFHGAFYAYKEQSPREVAELMAKILEVRYLDHMPDEYPVVQYCRFAGEVGVRTVSLLEETEHSGLVEGLTERLLHDPVKCFFKLIHAEEPLAVLCHGDFNRNNLMFKYNQITNELESMVFIDFQTPRYASPAIDLSFFFMMNISTENRARNFDRYFSIYHNSLIKTLEERLPDYDREKYSLGNFLEDYGRHSLYGYLIVAMFLPLCEPGERINVGGNVTTGDVVEFYRKRITPEIDLYLSHCLRQLCDRFGRKILK